MVDLMPYTHVKVEYLENLKAEVERLRNRDLRTLVLRGANFVKMNKDKGGIPDVYEQELVEESLRHMERHFIKEFGKVKGGNLVKKLRKL